MAKRFRCVEGHEWDRGLADPASGMLHADAPGRWSIWVSDADFVRSRLSDVETAGVRVVAFWRLGLEDPRLWDLLSARAP